MPGRKTGRGLVVAGVRAAIGFAAAMTLLAGCTSTSPTGTPSATSLTTPTLNTPTLTDPPTTSPPATASRPSVTAPGSTIRTTVTRTKPGLTITVGPPPATTEPAAVPGECPYLSADVVSDITGQHHGPTMLVPLAPDPMCIFYRSDGALMGSIRVIRATSPQSAAAAVDQHVPVAGSQPATQPSGWVGGSMSTAGQMTQDSTATSVYAVSRGDIAVVAQENESPSIKARVMAVCAIYGLKLQTGQAPDYCSGAQG